MMIPYKFPREVKQQLTQKVQAFFEEERGEEIGSLAAEFLLDFMLKEIGPYLYNQGIEDARRLLEEKMAALEEDLFALRRPEADVKQRF